MTLLGRKGLNKQILIGSNILKSGLTETGFKEAEVNPCVFYQNDVVLLVYGDDCIILSKESK